MLTVIAWAVLFPGVVFLLHRPDAAAAGDVDVLRRDTRQLQAHTVEETVAGA